MVSFRSVDEEILFFSVSTCFLLFRLENLDDEETLCLNFVSALHKSDFASCYQMAYRYNSVPPMQPKGSCDKTSKCMNIMCAFLLLFFFYT